MKFVKGKRKGTNPAIMGNLIDMTLCTVNGSKKQSILLLEKVYVCLYVYLYVFVCVFVYVCMCGVSACMCGCMCAYVHACVLLCVLLLKK